MSSTFRNVRKSAMLVGCVALMVSAQATSWDAGADFLALSTLNPSGPWHYGYDPAAQPGYQFKAFDLYVDTGVNAAGKGNRSWKDSTYNTLGTPAFFQNIGLVASGVLQPGQIALHPGPVREGDDAVLRFVAPESGNFLVDSQFFNAIGGTDAFVKLNGSVLMARRLTTGNPTYSARLLLKTGDTLDFGVGNTGEFFSDTTPLTVRISPVATVPEPASLSLWLLGLGGTGLWLRRRAPVQPLP